MTVMNVICPADKTIQLPKAKAAILPSAVIIAAPYLLFTAISVIIAMPCAICLWKILSMGSLIFFIGSLFSGMLMSGFLSLDGMRNNLACSLRFEDCFGNIKLYNDRQAANITASVASFKKEIDTRQKKTNFTIIDFPLVIIAIIQNAQACNAILAEEFNKCYSDIDNALLLFTEKVDEYAAQSENFCKKELEKYDIRTKAQYDDYAGMVYACKRVVKSPSEHCDETNQKCEAIRNAAKESAEELNREIMATRNNAINEMKKVAEKIKQELRNRHAHLLTQIMRVPPNNYAELIKSADDVMRD